MQSISSEDLVHELKASPRQLVLVEGIDRCQTFAELLRPEYRKRYVPYADPALARKVTLRWTFQLRAEHNKLLFNQRLQQVNYLSSRFEQCRLEQTVLVRSLWTTLVTRLLPGHNPRAIDPFRASLDTLSEEEKSAERQLEEFLTRTRAAVVILGPPNLERGGGKTATSLYLTLAQRFNDTFYVENPS
jgi:hypothetical protein